MSQLVEQFKKINHYQEKLSVLLDEKFILVSQKKSDEAMALMKKEMLLLYDLEQALVHFKNMIHEMCRHCGCPEGKLETLFPYLTTEEKEQLMACQGYAIRYEKIIKNKLKNVNRQVEMNMALPEILHRARVQHLKEQGVENSIYNEKF